MKNLRKVLALVLAVATIMSFAAVANAATFADADKISGTNNEAVYVLSGLGIIDGIKTGDETNYKPTELVTRAQMAKMIALIVTGGREDINTLYASANTFPDVANDFWAAGYIAYCANKGIITGRANGKFDPNANVTGVEAAKMMLVALGYDAANEAYQNSASWAANILDDADTKNLFKGVVTAYEKNITRQEAAQMLLNTLESTTVKYNQTSSSITVNGVTFVQGAGEAQDTADTLLSKTFPQAGRTDYADKFGRPGSQWTDANGELMDPIVEKPIISVAGGTIKVADIYAKVKKTGAQLFALSEDKQSIAVDNLTVFCESQESYLQKYTENEDVPNGTYMDPTVEKHTRKNPDGTDWKNSSDKTESNNHYSGREHGRFSSYKLAGMTSKSTATIGHNGIRTEVYWDGTELTVVHIIDRAGIIKDVDTTNKVLTIATWSETAEDYIGADIATDSTFKYTTGYTKDNVGDLVAVNVDYAKNKIANVTLCETKVVTSEGGVQYGGNTGVFTDYYTADGNFKSGYTNALKTFTPGEQYVLGFNTLGLVMSGKAYSETVDAKYLYVLDTATETATFGDTTYLAKVVTTDGVVEVIETAALATEDTLCSYTVNKEVYTLTTVVEGTDVDAEIANAIADATIVKAKAVLNGEIYANNKTVFVVETTVGTEKKYDVYTGIKNVPSIDVDKMFVIHTSNKASLVYCLGAAATGDIASTEMDYTVVYAKSGLNATNRVDANGQPYTYYTVTALIDGTSTSVKVNKAAYDKLRSGNKSSTNVISSMTKDDNGIVTDVTIATGNLTAATIGAKYADGVMTISGAKTFVEDTVVAYIYNGKSSKVMVAPVTKLTTAFSGWVLKDGDAIVAFYGYDSFS